MLAKPDIKDALGQISQISIDLQAVPALRCHTSDDPDLETVNLHVFSIHQTSRNKTFNVLNMKKTK